MLSEYIEKQKWGANSVPSDLSEMLNGKKETTTFLSEMCFVEKRNMCHLGTTTLTSIFVFRT